MLQRNGLPILLAAFVALALAYSVTVPLGEAPDEVSHWSYVQYLLSQHTLPKPEGAVLGESHQPPLYYVIGALATAWIPREEFPVIANPDFSLTNSQAANLLLHTRREGFPYQGVPLAWHLIRFLSIIMGAITVWSTWQIAHAFFPDDEWIALGAASFVAFLPGFISLSAVVNNDNLVVMLSSLSILLVARILRRAKAQPITWRDAGLLGVLMGLGALTKLSGLVIWLFAAAVFFYVATWTRAWKHIAIRAAVAFVIATTIIAPWTIYNLQAHGDPLGWSLLMRVTPVRQTPMLAGDWANVVQGLFTSFWGRFGGALHIHLPVAVYTALGGVALIAVVGWARRSRKTDEAVRVFILAFVSFWLLMLVSYVRWTLAVQGTDQARQLFPGLPLLSVFLAAGIAHFTSIRRRTVWMIWCGGFFTLALGILIYLQSLYYPSPSNLALPVQDGSNIPADFGGTIRIIDYRIDQTKVAPGKSITTQFDWQALKDPSQNYWLLLQLTNQNGTVAKQQDGVPSGGRVTTDWWLKGQTFESSQTLVIPKNTVSGTYTLRIGLHPFGKWQWLPVDNRDMLDLGTITVH